MADQDKQLRHDDGFDVILEGINRTIYVSDEEALEQAVKLMLQGR